MHHVVPVKPSQTIEICLCKATHENPQVLTTGYVKISKMEERDGYLVYTIVLSRQDYVWSFYSSCFLGEVWVHCNWFDPEDKPKLSKLCVVLQSSTKGKEKILTVINPDFYDIRVKPFQVLETIIYDVGFSEMDNWTYSWEPKVNLGLMEIGEDKFKISNYPTVLTEPKQDCTEFFTKLCRCDEGAERASQHHFWFRFSKQVIDLMGERSILHVGDLTITGYSWNDFRNWQNGPPDACREYHASLHLDCDIKHLNDFLDTARIHRKVPHCGLAVLDDQLIPLERTHFSRRKLLPNVKDVTITQKNASDLGDGCRVVPALPLPSMPSTQYEIDDLDYLDPWNLQTRSFRYHPRP